MNQYIAVDTGGTFTDLVSFHVNGEDVRYTKHLTTHNDPIIGIMACVEKVGLKVADAALFKHGTTHVINTLLERSGPPIALVSTKGFSDVLEFGRGNRTEPFNLFFRYDAPLVPRDRRFEVDERIDGTGKVLLAPARAEVEELAQTIKLSGAEGVAIAFINSYLEPKHELLVAGWLREMLPTVYISASVELNREWYEYERTSTAAANAYAGPRVGGYVRALAGALRERDFQGKFFMMGSNGGVLSPKHSAAAPVLLVESGPVGGCIGASAYGKALDIQNVIAFDMGGTTAKCALVTDGNFDVESVYYAGGYGRGIPIRAPVVDIVEVGAGGGSIAWLDDQNQMHVGPRSAGSNPGPVAYARGGTEPTVTDANLILGRLDASRFQGGEMSLDVPAAKSAMLDRLGRPLGYEGEEGILKIASGILAIASVVMSEAIKRITVQRGRNPGDFAMLAYGGGGPLHSVDLARELGIPLVIIPPEAGNFSAIGMLLADIRRDETRTFRHLLDADALRGLEQAFAEIESGMADDICRDFGDVPVAFERTLEMRFVGQYHTVRVPFDSNEVHLLRCRFLNVYRDRYGHAMDDLAAEIVAVHAGATAHTPKPDITKLARLAPPGATPPHHVRDVYFSERDALVETSVFARADLPAGFAVDGPAVIEEYGSTTVLGPDDRFEIGRLGELRIHVDVNKKEV
ncbi:hydantoinase/oxoprolinase family protein [Paraburkholderia fungorum]|uniref:hydantoinase/oxoprolinase family protein n=1 Tax=Paraburkholderia fungorum TaxID=134537 RepID=UPI00402B78C8